MFHYKLLLTVCFTLLCSCGPKLQPALFPVQGTPYTEERVLYGLSRTAAEGQLDFAKHKKFEYRFDGVPAFANFGHLPPLSFEIAYSLTGEGRPVLESGSHSWILPREGDLGDNAFGDASDSVIHYVIPIGDFFPEHFSVVPEDKTGKNAAKGTASRMQIHSIAITGRWYGFYRSQTATELSATLLPAIYTSPFISRQTDASWVIDPPAAFDPAAGFFPQLTVSLSPGKTAAVNAARNHFEAYPRLEQLIIPAGMIAPNEKPLVLSGDRVGAVADNGFFSLHYAALPPFPEPIAADPGMILAWPPEHWRDSRYEVFRWEHFPTLLIFDTADYAIQDRLFKRLAFFVEKAGFRGRLAPDEEIAELHGWNAHDYRPEDLARFFQLARTSHFPLLAEERELERILLNAGIIKESSAGIGGGEGGIISISRESADYLRFRFMAHEGFHGLFFIDEEFRAFSRRRWQQLPAEARRFIIAYFNYQRYDTTDEYLRINEFMAHILQQPVSQAGRYFGETLPSRLEENSWRKSELPAKDEASGTWPSLAAAFTREAEAFSAYVNSRWGLAAGRVHLVTVRDN